MPVFAQRTIGTRFSIQRKTVVCRCWYFSWAWRTNHLLLMFATNSSLLAGGG